MSSFKRRVQARILCACLLFVLGGCAGGRYLRMQRPEGKKEASIEGGEAVSSPTIRVAAAIGLRSFSVSGRGIRAASSDGAVTIAGAARIEIHDEWVRVGGAVLRLPVTLAVHGGGHPIEMNGRLFDGELIVYRDLIVNTLPLETYVRGVLASEMPAGWPEEALKAQAVVSRTFAWRKILDRKGELYDVVDSEMDQKYSFAGRVDPMTDAVRATEGIILSYDGAPIEAFFHASSGGVTESCRNVFQRDLPYLRSIRDPYTERAAEPGWECELRAGEIAQRIPVIHPKAPDDYAVLKDIRVRSLTDSGRVAEFALLFDRGRERIVRGNDFRLAVGPKTFKSLLLNRIERKTADGALVFRFSGKGYGHGVGMSQVGAKGMAELGFGFGEILAFYYRGARVERWNGG